MLKKLMLTTSLLLTFALGATTQASQKSFKLRWFQTLTTQGFDEIDLKRELRMQGHFISEDAQLDQVIVVGKSRVGRGIAALQIGWNEVDSVRLGNPYNDFFSNQSYTFDRQVLRNFGNQQSQSWDNWTITLRGNIKILELDVVVKIPASLNWARIESFTLDNGYDKSLRIRMPHHIGLVKAIRISVDRRDVRLSDVTVRFGNGESRRIRELMGHYSQNSGETYTFQAPQGRIIREILVRGQTVTTNKKARVDLSVLHSAQSLW